jgi:hypothetical protein
MTSTLLVSVRLAFAVAYAFTMMPMLRTVPLVQTAKVTIIGYTTSILAMELTENVLAFIIPGFMMATMADANFWLGLGILRQQALRYHIPLCTGL